MLKALNLRGLGAWQPALPMLYEQVRAAMPVPRRRLPISVAIHCRGVPRPGGPPDRRARGPQPRRRAVGDSWAALFRELPPGCRGRRAGDLCLLMVAVARYRRIAPRDALYSIGHNG